MKDEKIIRGEANSFFERSLSFGSQHMAIDQFEKIRSRLLDFYSAEAKSTFLDEIRIHLLSELQKHRDKYHGGNAKEDCNWEIQAERLLFYIRQEVGTLPLVAHQKNPTLGETKRGKVFVSYSHVDKDFLSDIKRHFKPFLKKIDFWDDSQIAPGQKWKEQITIALAETKVAILLVSTDFLGSGFIATDELPPLLDAAEKEGAVILILILRPCLFEEFPELNQFQALNPPTKPISEMDANEREHLYVNLVRQTKRILEEKGENV